ncbi:MAG: type IV toxin-antitoxin system AbiEi family antitoxin, partial [Bradymonadaceae bacterium]
AISTPEATALDLVGYANRIGGPNRVATILVELADHLDGDELREVGPQIAPDAWLQRLGYLLEATGAEEVSRPLADYVRDHVDEVTPLRPEENGKSGRPRDTRWQVAVNHEVEPDL